MLLIMQKCWTISAKSWRNWKFPDNWIETKFPLKLFLLYANNELIICIFFSDEEFCQWPTSVAMTTSRWKKKRKANSFILTRWRESRVNQFKNKIQILHEKHDWPVLQYISSKLSLIYDDITFTRECVFHWNRRAPPRWVRARETNVYGGH